MVASGEKIIVSGAGLTAELMVLALQRQGIDCVLVGGAQDTCPMPQYSSARTVAIWRKGLEILDDLGIDAAELDDSYPINALCLIDEKGAETRFSAAQAQWSTTSSSDYFGRNIRLSALLQVLKQRNNNVERVHARSHRWLGAGVLQLSNQQIMHAPLIIVAEGKKSSTARQAGIVPVRFHQGLSAVIMPVRHATPHQHTSFEFHRPPGPLAFVPLQEYHSAIVWLHEEHQAPDLVDHDHLIILLNQASQHKMQVEQILDTPHHIVLGSQQTLTLRADRLCLIGESAHKLPPTGAQGLNLTLRDIASLADLLAQAHRNAQDLGHASLLAQYSQQRLKDNLAVSLAVHTANNSIRHADRLGGMPGLLRRTLQHSLLLRFPKLTKQAMYHALYGF